MTNFSKIGLALGIAGITFVLMNGNASAISVNDLSELQNAINSGESEISISGNITGSVNIPAGSSVSIDGNGNTINGGITFGATITDPSNSSTHASISNLILNGNTTTNYGLISQNQETEPAKLYLDLYNVTVKDFVNKGAYFTNVQSLTIDNCTFDNNATTATSWYKGDYAIDVNLVGIQNAQITVENSTFNGIAGGKGAIKITQRGTSDDIMTDIPYYYNGGQPTGNPPASISLMSIENNNFDGVTPKSDGKYMGDVIKGSSPNADGTARTLAGEFPYVLVAGGSNPTSFFVRGSSEQETNNAASLLTEIPAGSADYDQNNVITVNVDFDSPLDIPSKTLYILKGTSILQGTINQIISTAEAKITDPDSQKVQLLVDGVAYDPDSIYDNDVVITVSIINTESNEPVVGEKNPNTVDASGLYALLASICASGLAGAYLLKKQA